MKKWWPKDLFDFRIHWFAMKSTRWIAVLLFLCLAAFANWQVVYGLLRGEVFGRYAGRYTLQSEPVSYTILLSISMIYAVLSDIVIVIGAAAVSREIRKRRVQEKTKNGSRSESPTDQ